jgi:SAM-dependent methyltransferase
MADSAAHYNPDDFATLRLVEDTHFWFVGRNDILGAALATLTAEGFEPKSVLEVGCGTGNTLRVLRESFPNAALVGMDAYHAGLLHARPRTDARLVEGRLEHLPFRRPFSLIAMFDVLEHIEDDLGALQAIRTSLEPGGRLALTVPAGPSLWSRYDEECQHQRRYTARHLRQILTAAEFHVDYLTCFMSVTYPATWISRRLESVLAIRSRRSGRPRESAIDREMRVPPIINTVFRELLRLEVPLIRRRRSLWWGTSILAIARSRPA